MSSVVDKPSNKLRRLNIGASSAETSNVNKLYIKQTNGC